MSNNWLTDAIALEAKYDEGYEAGKQAVLDKLKTGIETFLTDDEVDVIIAEGRANTNTLLKTGYDLNKKSASWQ